MTRTSRPADQADPAATAAEIRALDPDRLSRAPVPPAGATILSLRVDHGTGSQADLASELTNLGAAVSEAKVRRWEAGDHAPDAWEISRLCALFGIEAADLIQPDALTDREIQLYRRAARQVARTIHREREVG